MKPVVLDLGKQKSKRIKDLKRGEGLLMDQVEAAILQAKAETAGAKDVIPVVLVYQRKTKKRGASFMAPY